MVKKNDLICFVHIEKAAGTTLKHIFRRVFYLRHLTVRPYFKPQNFENRPYSAIFGSRDLRLVLLLNPFVKIISGHSLKPYGDLEKVSRQIKYITILRNPVDRYFSQYGFSTRVMGNKWTFDEFMNIEEHNNFQTKKIAGKEDLNLAMEILKTKFFIVGTVENFNSFLSLLSLKLGIKKAIGRYEIRNRKKGEKGIEKLKQQYHEKVAEKNDLDILLYKFVEEVIFPKYKKELLKELLDSHPIIREKKLTVADKVRIKSDFYLESVYYEPITSMIRMVNGLTPKGSYF